jgi:hypothetical protein
MNLVAIPLLLLAVPLGAATAHAQSCHPPAGFTQTTAIHGHAEFVAGAGDRLRPRLDHAEPMGAGDT